MEEDFDFDSWFDEAVAASKRGELPTWEMDQIESHPLFSTTVPENIQDYPALVAMQELIYGEGETPLSIATNFKNHGNDALKVGKLANAIQFYSDALAQNAEDSKLNSILYANRAQAYLSQGSLVECTQDARRALALDRSNTKASYRGAAASEKLELFSQSCEFAQQGLVVDPQNKELLEILERSTIRKREVAKAQESSRALMSKKDKMLADALSLRKVTLGPSHYEYPVDIGKVELSDDNELVFPMLFLYDEVSQSDWVTGASEFDTLEDHFNRMFEVKPDWAHTYQDPKDMAFFLEVLSSSEASEKTVCFRVKRTLPIGQLISNTKLSGFPIVHVIPKSATAALARFLDENTVVVRK